nr:hypothetical protein L203_04423 [Cryptococcus depauperatus CBS 7841]
MHWDGSEQVRRLCGWIRDGVDPPRRRGNGRQLRIVKDGLSVWERPRQLSTCDGASRNTSHAWLDYPRWSGMYWEEVWSEGCVWCFESPVGAPTKRLSTCDSLGMVTWRIGDSDATRCIAATCRSQHGLTFPSPQYRRCRAVPTIHPVFNKYSTGDPTRVSDGRFIRVLHYIPTPPRATPAHATTGTSVAVSGSARVKEQWSYGSYRSAMLHGTSQRHLASRQLVAEADPANPAPSPTSPLSIGDRCTRRKTATEMRLAVSPLIICLTCNVQRATRNASRDVWDSPSESSHRFHMQQRRVPRQVPNLPHRIDCMLN